MICIANNHSKPFVSFKSEKRFLQQFNFDSKTKPLALHFRNKLGNE